MDQLSLHDPPSHPPQPQPQNPPHSQNGAPPPTPQPQGPPQLPPQMFTTATQLLDLTDKKLVLVLRDGRKLLGILRSWDQFANLVLTSTVERLFVVVPTTDTASSASTHTGPETNAPTHVDGETGTRTLYCDIPRGTYLVRGENVLLLGEVDLDRDDSPPPGCEVGDVAEIFRLRSAEEERRKVGDKIRGRRAAEWWGGEVEGSGEVLFY